MALPFRIQYCFILNIATFLKVYVHPKKISVHSSLLHKLNKPLRHFYSTTGKQTNLHSFKNILDLLAMVLLEV